MLQAVLFDMDGLLFDTETAYSIVQSSMSKRRGKVFTNEVKRTLMGRRAGEVMELLNTFWGKNETVQRLLEEQDEELVRVYNNTVEKMDGMDDLVRFLNQHMIRKCIGTSSRRFLVDVLLRKHRLVGAFEFIVSGDMVTKGKPDPEIYDSCVARLGVPASKCLVLEDSLNGVKAGIAAGCHTCVIPSEYTKNEDFSEATLIGKSLGDPAIKEFILK